MKIFLKKRRGCLQEATKAQMPAKLRGADSRVVNDVLRAAGDLGADEFAKQLLLGFLGIESGGRAKATFYNPDMAKYAGQQLATFTKPRSGRYAGPFAIIHGGGKRGKDGYTSIERAYKKYGYDPTKFGDAYHQATVVLRYIENKRRKFGDNPTRIYLSWNQGGSGSAAIYRALKNNPNLPVGSKQFDAGLAKRMKANFSHLSFKRHGISNKNQMTPRMFVSNYARHLGFVGGAVTTPGAPGAPRRAPGKRYVIIAGNSHAGATFSKINNEYKRLEKETGIDYVIKRIDKPQGHGGEIPAQLAKIKKLGNELRAKGATVAAVIHTGTNRYKSHAKDLDELAKQYTSLTSNVTFIGSPTSRSDFKGSSKHVEWNDWLKNNLPKHGIKYIETAGVTGDKDLIDDVHLSRKGYSKMMSNAIPAINFDSGVSSSVAAAPRFASAGRSFAGGPGELSGGSFVHGISPIEKFKFDVFYNNLLTYFGADAIEKMLPAHGKDYKFGREHQIAYDELQKAKAASSTVDTRTASGPPGAGAAADPAPVEGKCPEGSYPMPDGYCYEDVESAEETEYRALPIERYMPWETRDPTKHGKVKQLKDYSMRLSESKKKQKIKIKVLTRNQTI